MCNFLSLKVDENLNTESLEKIVGYFNTLHPQLLLSSGDCSIHQGQLLADLGKAVLCAIDSIQADANIILAHVQQVCELESSNFYYKFLHFIRISTEIFFENSYNVLF